MLSLVLIDVQYLQNVVFSFEKDSNGQNHYLPDSHYSIKKLPQQNFIFLPLAEIFPIPLNAIWKTLMMEVRHSLQNFHVNYNPVIQ